MAPWVNTRSGRDIAGAVRIVARGALMRPLQYPVGAPFMAPWLMRVPNVMTPFMAPGVDTRAGRDDAIYGQARCVLWPGAH